ncbi:MAG: riboflavin biosynthesis protein RibF [Clostridia bacterium]|nr:riboflavin biosynthesis protein RibF [Clostridia bacterium]
MSDNIIGPVVIALGYFDSVHTGHQHVIKTAKEYADTHGAKLVVFTFKGNLKAMLCADDDKCVYMPKEREKFIKELGADEIYFAPVDFNFLSLGKRAFLNKLNKKYSIICYVSGKDYRFGKFGKGTVDDLKEYANNSNQEYIVVEDFNLIGKKVSTTAIKKLLSVGDIESANKLLGRNYSVTGKVYGDRQVGTKLGFPTVNIRLEKDKFRIKDGVYAGKVNVDELNYKALINYGARPTFDLSDKVLEAHIVDFDGDLYGKEITLEFNRRIRDIKKFFDPDGLKKQLNEDLRLIKEDDYD